VRSMASAARTLSMLLLAVNASTAVARPPQPSSADHVAPPAPSVRPLPVVELRQYTLLPGKRDVLIDLFERELIEGQESLGMTIVGQFRDLDRPNRFVWIRAFPDMRTRARSLAALYGRPGRNIGPSPTRRWRTAATSCCFGQRLRALDLHSKDTLALHEARLRQPAVW
jgi:hypothetical protein